MRMGEDTHIPKIQCNFRWTERPDLFQTKMLQVSMNLLVRDREAETAGDQIKELLEKHLHKAFLEMYKQIANISGE